MAKKDLVGKVTHYYDKIGVAVIALKKTAHPKWSSVPVPLALLLRIDNGALDRPSHVEFSPKIKIGFKRLLEEYAELDAEYFAYRILMGAWSTGNYSLDGRIIDLETVSFIKYRGPYTTASSKYPENRFGYEGPGFIRILKQLAETKGIRWNNSVKKYFWDIRKKNLAYCFLLLLGMDKAGVGKFLSKHIKKVMVVSEQFERLAKITNSLTGDLNLYYLALSDPDPCLLDMSNLFRHLAELREKNKREEAYGYLVRNAVFKTYTDGHGKKTDADIKTFIRGLFRIIDILNAEKCLPEKSCWRNNLLKMNQDLPTMFELNGVLKKLIEDYRTGRISPMILWKKVENLCELPLSAASGLITLTQFRS